ncbi:MULTISPECIES: methyltransferase [Pontibacillus]|uniref:Methyltransferase n=1 Tax=Pontibacillus chungwhensis TaxID=265426 RepID=A0ABY8V1S2_9BACI|nr:MULTISPECIES: methyltransferase [Pontibacillus]MCD5325429.1 class I SAM-dependent methyltransferase [Pontibacillus sp. HN14]WIF98544.1 methyltransferase [Pontibacillus chungwhensis]
MISNALTLILLALILLILISIVTRSSKNGITPTPTSPKVKEEVTAIVKNYTPTTIADFGAGWGTMAFALAKEFPHTDIYAYETSLVPYLYMKGMAKLKGYSNVRILKKDFFTVRAGEFDLIYCYLFTGAMKQLSPMFASYNGTVISNTFALPNTVPTATKNVASWLGTTPIYIYK